MNNKVDSPRCRAVAAGELAKGLAQCVTRRGALKKFGVGLALVALAAASGVRADVVVGSAADPREASSLADYAVRPGALVMTEGAAGGRIETGEGTRRFAAPRAAPTRGGSYGAGDSFAGALTWYAALGLPLDQACARASAHGAAVLGSLEPIEAQLPLPERMP